MTPSSSPILIHYPSCDGKPKSDNTKQGRWITVLYGNLSALYRNRADVFVALDNLWYPVEGEPTICNAPDVYLAFGRPKGDRSSYKQWDEGDIPLTVVFEILSPGNTPEEMHDKFYFYEEHGVEEYYVYDPDRNDLEVYVRRTATLVRQHPGDGFVSPRMGIRFDLSGEEMVVIGPDGLPFLTFDRLTDESLRQRERADKAEERADKATQQLTRLKELSRKARRGQASTEEITELERLEDEQRPT